MDFPLQIQLKNKFSTSKKKKKSCRHFLVQKKKKISSVEHLQEIEKRHI